MRTEPIPPSSFRDRLWILRGELKQAFKNVLGDPLISIDGIVTDDLERAPATEAEIVPKLVASFVNAKKYQATLAGPYVPGAEWKIIIDQEWSGFWSVVESGDVKSQASFLRNFFRNEALSGFWGGDQMFGEFTNPRSRWRPRARAELMERQIAVWREQFPHTPISDLDAPLVGNPWGYAVNQNLLYEPVCEYHYQADYFAGLLREIARPNIVEIGGGFGGLAHHILKRAPQCRYVGFDLPEVALLQSYYLSCVFPDAKLLVYQAGMQSFDTDGFDIAVLPNFMLPNFQDAGADLVINVRSLSEMPKETIEEYLPQIDRIGRLFFFHENIYKPRTGPLHGIPSSAWPGMKNFVEVASSESRWPRYDQDSAYPCRENLFIHSAALA